jgi:hypothetical protein
MWVREKAPDEEGCLAGIYVQPNQTIPGMDKAVLVEILISAQQRRLFQPQQEGHNVVIVHSLAMEIARDGTEPNTPLKQELSLVPSYIFIEDAHAAAGTSSVKWPARSNRARRASWTASAIASLEIFPSPQR